MKHISIRVPWHDNNWNGHVCNCPSSNPFCMMLKNISSSKDCAKEDLVASIGWDKLRIDQLPACKGDNGAFMNEDKYQRRFVHVYQKNLSTPQSKLKPTDIVIPEYSFFGVPFRYLSREMSEELDQRFPQFHEEEIAPFKSSWTYGRERQYDILRWFSSNIKAGQSLVTFYCKNGNPIDEDARRIIVGMGEVSWVSPILDYDSDEDYTYPFWEIMMSHTIRKDLGQSKGFLLPYKEYLALDENIIKEKTNLSKSQAIKEIKLTLEKLGNSTKIFNELSYGCEYVSNHSMLIILNAARLCLENVKKHDLIGGNWDMQLRWIDEKIAQVKSLIGPFPSFAEGLRTIGVNYAYLIEQDLRNHAKCGIKDNPWIFFDKYMQGEYHFEDVVYNEELAIYKKSWNSITDDGKRVLELLSRFEINSDIMNKWFSKPELYETLICNPYKLSENCSIGLEGTVTPEMVDLGVVCDREIQGDYAPLPPSCIETPIDERRIRAYVIHKLKLQSYEGDTLMSMTELEKYLSEILNNDNVNLPVNYLKTYQTYMEESLHYIENAQNMHNYAIQLHEFYMMECELRKIFSARAKRNVKVTLNEDWSSLVKSVKGYDENEERSVSAANDQIRALEMFGSKRLCVLTGPAGTGKTSVVEAFLNCQQIKSEGILLLAPTGKARVKLGKQSNSGEALTIAQFLTRQRYFDWQTMRASDTGLGYKYSQSKNIIVDECSMLTTNDFYILLKALDLKIINRIILIGDPYQLPPIGEGRTFSDLCNYLKKEVPDAITNLKTVVRTIHTGDSDILALASWFSGTKPLKNADEIFEKMQQGKLNGDLSVYTWKDESCLKQSMLEVLEKELEYPELQIKDRVVMTLGLDDIEKAIKDPSVVERFQILSPVKNPVWGTYQLNVNMQELLGHSDSNYKIQMFPNDVCYRDKVIQLKNERKETLSRSTHQLSNGQIGFVCHATNKNANVCFSGISDEKFLFFPQKSEDKEQTLDLAYAITIHKSQGSDFDTVLVILPKNGIILSRELIYTALTRAKKRLILLVEDNMQWMMEFSKPQQSILAQRNTNLFECSVREEKHSIPYVEGLIHKTLSGTIVRSKSEVIIADALTRKGITFDYEKLLEEGGHRCIPDFTFEDAGGDIIIWEHLGLLDNPSYKAAWEKKLQFYKSIGFVEGETLFTTQDHEGGSIDSSEIENVVNIISELV